MKRSLVAHSFIFDVLSGFLGFLFLLTIPSMLWGQLTNSTDEGRRGAPRIQKISARTAAMGDATVGDPSYLSVININPAGLSHVENLKTAQINISQNWNNNVMLENFTLPALNINRHTLAAQFSIHHDRGFESLNLLGTNPMPEPKIMMYQLDVAYSFTIVEVLSFGVLNNFSYAQNRIAHYWTYNPTLGIMYAPSASISYGVVFRGLGRSVIYNVVNPSGRLTTLGSQNLRESLELGASLQFPINSDKPYLSISMANEKRFGEEGIWYKGGIELETIPHLSIRTGMIFQPETEVYAPRFGIGLNSKILTLDYSISYSQELYERFHQLGITFHLDKF